MSVFMSVIVALLVYDFAWFVVQVGLGAMVLHFSNKKELE